MPIIAEFSEIGPAERAKEPSRLVNFEPGAEAPATWLRDIAQGTAREPLRALPLGPTARCFGKCAPSTGSDGPMNTSFEALGGRGCTPRSEALRPASQPCAAGPTAPAKPIRTANSSLRLRFRFRFRFLVPWNTHSVRVARRTRAPTTRSGCSRDRQPVNTRTSGPDRATGSIGFDVDCHSPAPPSAQAQGARHR